MLMQVYTYTDRTFQVLKIWKCQASVKKTIFYLFNDYGKSNCRLQNNLVLFNLSVIDKQEIIKDNCFL